MSPSYDSVLEVASAPSTEAKDQVQVTTASMPTEVEQKKDESSEGRFTKIPGPLGLESARLKGKVAVVTGAGRGIGKEVALEFARRGARVIVNYANSEKAAEAVVAQIKKEGSDAVAFKANVASVPEITTFFEQAKAVWGKIDIVCSNAGVVSFGHLLDVTEEEFDRVFDINVKGQFFVTQQGYKHMEIGGRLIMMSSITAQSKGIPRHGVYSASKAAIEGFVRSLTIDVGEKKCTVNCIAPGGIRTDMYHAVCREYIPGGLKFTNEQVDEYAATWSPLNRVGLPIDVARNASFLASQDGGWTNGKVMGVDGGACM